MKSVRWRIGVFETSGSGCAMNMPTPCSPLFGAKRQHQLEHRRIGGEALAVLDRIDEPRRRHHLETLVDADEKFRRNDRRLDGAELHAFDLARDRAELARRIDLALDAAAGIPLDRGSKILGQLMRPIVDGGHRDLHHVSFVLRLASHTDASRTSDTIDAPAATAGAMIPAFPDRISTLPCQAPVRCLRTRQVGHQFKRRSFLLLGDRLRRMTAAGARSASDVR